MEIYKYLSICLCIYSIVASCHALKDEPTCFSKYDFEERLLEKMVRNEHKMELFENSIKGIEDEYKAEKQAIQSTFDTQKEELRQVIDAFKIENLEIKSELEAIKANNDLMVHGAMVRETRINNVLNATLEKAVSDITGRLETPAIAFQARGVSSKNPPDGQPLVFPTVLLNLGNGYDPTTGIFTAPVRGLYVFNAQVSVEPNKWIHVQLLHNGDIINAFAAGDTSYRASNTGFAVTELAMGDRIEVMKLDAAPNALYRSEIKRWNMFTGALVVETRK